jgi:GNAT superfamily N-acetyltransferase
MGAPPAGLRLVRLGDDPSAGHAEARAFCLDTIREFYGFDYRVDWHADLDSLLLPAERNHYSRRNGGAFWVLYGEDGGLVATAGVRHLAWKPNIVRMFSDRYPDGGAIASLWRVYVRKDRRGQGIGRWLTALSESEAAGLGYRTMYLHASADTPATLAFWQAMGYGPIGADDETAHFDKGIA